MIHKLGAKLRELREMNVLLPPCGKDSVNMRLVSRKIMKGTVSNRSKEQETWVRIYIGGVK